MSFVRVLDSVPSLCPPVCRMWQLGWQRGRSSLGHLPLAFHLHTAWPLAGTHSTGKDQSYPGNQHGRQCLLQAAPCHSALYETFLFSVARQRVCVCGGGGQRQKDTGLLSMVDSVRTWRVRLTPYLSPSTFVYVPIASVSQPAEWVLFLHVLLR